LGYRKVEDMPADAELQAVEAELSAEQVTDEAAAEPTV